MRSVIHREHGGLPEVIKWRTCQFVDGFDIQWVGLYGGGEVRIDNDDMLDIEFKCVDEITQDNEDMGCMMNKRLACGIAEELVYMMREIRDNPDDELKGLDTIGTKTEDSYLTRDIVNLLMEIEAERTNKY